MGVHAENVAGELPQKLVCLVSTPFGDFHMQHIFNWLPSRKQPAAPYAEATRSGLLGVLSILRA